PTSPPPASPEPESQAEPNGIGIKAVLPSGSPFGTPYAGGGGAAILSEVASELENGPHQSVDSSAYLLEVLFEVVGQQ
ncbi:MAG TPA: hypothetical protein VEF03_01415, partial [Candidatus Binataceae bacterium]|nr:hypothetical protein [Candidatus Binataceae bacterium]